MKRQDEIAAEAHDLANRIIRAIILTSYLDSCGIFRDAVLSILATIAKQERVRRSERASAAIAKLRRQGKTDHLGRKRKILGAKLETVRQLREEGLSLRAIAARVHVSAMTVQRVLAQ